VQDVNERALQEVHLNAQKYFDLGAAINSGQPIPAWQSVSAA
jgi:hypothetical protein